MILSAARLVGSIIVTCAPPNCPGRDVEDREMAATDPCQHPAWM